MSVKENRLASLNSLKAGETERMLGGDGCGWIGEVDGRIVGFAIADLSGTNVMRFGGTGFERRGIGRLLHDTMMACFFSNQVSSVWSSKAPNTRAEGFYRKAGWTVTGEEPNGEIRFEMTRDRWLTR
jgi:hypothetical protein